MAYRELCPLESASVATYRFTATAKRAAKDPVSEPSSRKKVG